MKGAGFRRNVVLVVGAAVAALGGFFGQGASLDPAGAQRANAGTGTQNADPARPSPTPASSSIAKLRDLNFLRSRGPRKHTYRGVAMTVAEGKRRARKRRNRARHKAHATKARRRT